MVNLDRIRRSLVRRWTRMVMPLKYTFQIADTCWCGHPVLFPLLNMWTGFCFQCGTQVLHQRLTPESAQRFYAEGGYRRYMRGTYLLEGSGFHRGVRRGIEIAAYLLAHSVQPRSVVEAGCGSGGILAALRDEFHCQVAGCDPDLACAYATVRHGIFAEAKSGWTVYGFDQPDLVVLSHVLEHVFDPLEWLCGCGEYGKWVYLETPVWSIQTPPQLPHLWYFTPASIRLMASRANLEIVAMDDSIRAILRRKHHRRESNVEIPG